MRKTFSTLTVLVALLLLIQLACSLSGTGDSAAEGDSAPALEEGQSDAQTQ